MAVGSNGLMRDAKLRAEPCWGVADNIIIVSERVVSNRAKQARVVTNHEIGGTRRHVAV